MVCVCPSPPGVPRASQGRSLLRTMTGHSVWNGRLRGANTFGWSSSNLNSDPRFCSTMPVSGTTSPEPNVANRLWISETTLRSLSTAVR